MIITTVVECIPHKLNQFTGGLFIGINLFKKSLLEHELLNQSHVCLHVWYLFKHATRQSLLHCLTSTALTSESSISNPLAHPSLTKDNPPGPSPVLCLLSSDNIHTTNHLLSTLKKVPPLTLRICVQCCKWNSVCAFFIKAIETKGYFQKMVVQLVSLLTQYKIKHERYAL